MWFLSLWAQRPPKHFFSHFMNCVPHGIWSPSVNPAHAGAEAPTGLRSWSLGLLYLRGSCGVWAGSCGPLGRVWEGLHKCSDICCEFKGGMRSLTVRGPGWSSQKCKSPEGPWGALMCAEHGGEAPVSSPTMMGLATSGDV